MHSFKLLGGYCRSILRVKSSRRYSNKNILRLKERGLFSDMFPDNNTNEMLDLLNSEPQTVYAGFDPTASSLHVGNLLVLVNLIHWQRSGHKVIALLGSATAQVGDPSGKTSERPELSLAVIDHNAASISEVIKRIFTNHEELIWKKERQPDRLPPIKIVNNTDWYNDMSALDFIGKLGRNFKIGVMLGKQSVRDRLQSEQGMTFTEFTYQILQAYDWLHLCANHKCRFQVGGSDQKGNIVSGYDLIQKVSTKKVYGLTLPLVTTEEGDKFGKSAGNAVWLSQDKTTAFHLYQFFIRSKDADVEKLLKLFTFEPIDKIKEIMEAHMSAPEKRLAQKRLAECVTLLVHGEAGLTHAETVTSAVFVKDIETLKNLQVRDFQVIFGGTLTKLLLQPGITVLEAAMKAGCFQSEHDAIRIISAGGFSINYQRVSNVSEVLTQASHILPNNISLMRVGKKNYTVVLWT